MHFGEVNSDTDQLALNFINWYNVSAKILMQNGTVFVAYRRTRLDRFMNNLRIATDILHRYKKSTHVLQLRYSVSRMFMQLITLHEVNRWVFIH